MKDFLMAYMTWVLAFVAIAIVGGWLVHFADIHVERGPERHPDRHLDGP